MAEHYEVSGDRWVAYCGKGYLPFAWILAACAKETILHIWESIHVHDSSLILVNIDRLPAAQRDEILRSIAWQPTLTPPPPSPTRAAASGETPSPSASQQAPGPA